MSNKIQYRRVGDYLIPNLILPPEEAKVTLGKWGIMHKTYLEKHKYVFFNTLLMQGKLYQHCAESPQLPATKVVMPCLMKGTKNLSESFLNANQSL